MIEVGDWVVINCPEKPWFHGEMGEVVELYPNPFNSVDPLHSLTLAFSRTPGFYTTTWRVGQVIPIPRSESDPVAVLGEEYFA